MRNPAEYAQEGSIIRRCTIGTSFWAAKTGLARHGTNTTDHRRSQSAIIISPHSWWQRKGAGSSSTASRSHGTLVPLSLSRKPWHSTLWRPRISRGLSFWFRLSVKWHRQHGEDLGYAHTQLDQRWRRAKGAWELVFRWCNIPMTSLLQEFTDSFILTFYSQGMCTLYHTARGIETPMVLVQASNFRYSRSCRPSVYSSWGASSVPSLRPYLKLSGRTRLTCIVGSFTQ